MNFIKFISLSLHYSDVLLNAVIHLPLLLRVDTITIIITATLMIIIKFILHYY